MGAINTKHDGAGGSITISVAEAQRFISLYDASWQAFYNNEPLPELVW